MDVAYNAFANAGEAPEEAGISADNDVYIGGDLEVDGTFTEQLMLQQLPWPGTILNPQCRSYLNNGCI